MTLSDLPEEVPVLVVGAGPTGLTCASLLDLYGVDSLVLERHEDVYPLPRAVHLDDEVFRLLQRVGAAEGFARVSRPAQGMRLVDGRLRTIAEFRRDSASGVHGWPQANLFDQPDLEGLLRAGLAHRPRVTLRTGVEVEHVAPGDALRPASVRVRCLKTGDVRTVTAPVVLGCDGAGSLVRTAVGARMRDLRFTERWLVVDVRCARRLDLWDGVDQVCDPARAATFLRVGDDRYRWEFRMLPDETPEALTSDAALARLLAPWLRDVPMAEVTVIRSASYTFKARVADRWRAGRLFLLGDAAHLTPPFIGQGMGAGLRDAANLAWKLAASAGALPAPFDAAGTGTGAKGHPDPVAYDRLLATYEAERRPQATRMIRLAVTTGWVMTGGQDAAAVLRRGLFGALARLPGFAALMLRGVAPRLPRGPLAAGRRRDRLSGTPLPQPRVAWGNGSALLDEPLGPGWAVVTRAAPTPEVTALAARFDAVVVHAGPDRVVLHLPDGAVTASDGGALAGWLRRGRATTVLVRPDRAVLADAAWRALPS
ncbi:bifunctional 3-(3-hydroxy-phenyl)propionate/3-hydroxycinnamic acid hydroxylase [Actinocorallia sp. API 0066]|uniref:bifunctional 3-(3-hydroxy-phenyl)propionate/3-hydroxycinnamic acid hydroxylase MhpA n=1 Tax=Actinocorallia sp. API 0066 TaxID=2896846 RepID=UPI001E4C0ACF|nr:bifunctional 3-(3-hydroxy-phenyl)propionate/3-hydroxycinnamic acid hydroxylase [Actinocorallia sp. API 0066]MCD0449669.1 bifunctional 3-(3-hydroxy-phenyl)propionate/3-hydroxycinnamic acid hydroxylase [Actinocorallia sp. API 0066]